jgi:DNA repair exonuclease SbcCD ATPase subunit
MDIDGLNLAYTEFNRDFLLRKGQRETLLAIIDDKQKKLQKIEHDIDIYQKVNVIYRTAAEYARSQSKRIMENLVTNALTIVFPGDLKFQVELDEKGAKAEAHFFVSSTYGGDRVVCNEPQEARGGGIVDIIALALRVALLETSRPPLGGPLILDEPAKHVSEEYSRSVAQFLNMVVKNFGRQVVMVTHNQHLADAGSTSYEVAIVDGKSKVAAKFLSDDVNDSSAFSE